MNNPLFFLSFAPFLWIFLSFKLDVVTATTASSFSYEINNLLNDIDLNDPVQRKAMIEESFQILNRSLIFLSHGTALFEDMNMNMNDDDDSNDTEDNETSDSDSENIVSPLDKTFYYLKLIFRDKFDSFKNEIILKTLTHFFKECFGYLSVKFTTRDADCSVSQSDFTKSLLILLYHFTINEFKVSQIFVPVFFDFLSRFAPDHFMSNIIFMWMCETTLKYTFIERTVQYFDPFRTQVLVVNLVAKQDPELLHTSSVYIRGMYAKILETEGKSLPPTKDSYKPTIIDENDELSHFQLQLTDLVTLILSTDHAINFSDILLKSLPKVDLLQVISVFQVHSTLEVNLKSFLEKCPGLFYLLTDLFFNEDFLINQMDIKDEGSLSTVGSILFSIKTLDNWYFINRLNALNVNSQQVVISSLSHHETYLNEYLHLTKSISKFESVILSDDASLIAQLSSVLVVITPKIDMLNILNINLVYTTFKCIEDFFLNSGTSLQKLNSASSVEEDSVIVERFKLLTTAADSLFSLSFKTINYSIVPLLCLQYFNEHASTILSHSDLTSLQPYTNILVKQIDVLTDLDKFWVDTNEYKTLYDFYKYTLGDSAGLASIESVFIRLLKNSGTELVFFCELKYIAIEIGIYNPAVFDLIISEYIAKMITSPDSVEFMQVRHELLADVLKEFEHSNVLSKTHLEVFKLFMQ